MPSICLCLVTTFWVLMLTCHAQAAVHIEVTPAFVPAQGQKVHLRCGLSNNTGSAYPKDPQTCRFRWTKETISQNTKYILDVYNNKNVEITSHIYTNLDVHSHLTLKGMHTGFVGVYTCALECRNFRQSAVVRLDMSNRSKNGHGFTSSEELTRIMGFVATGLVICVFVIASGILIRECYRARVARRRIPRATPRTAITRRLSLDLPPRYSLVANVSRNEQGQSTIIGPVRMISTEEAQRLPTRMLSREEVQSIFVISESPPAYDKALQQLEAEGIVFNPQTLKPMPPAYKDIEFSTNL